jgi:hypothetical protein
MDGEYGLSELDSCVLIFLWTGLGAEFDLTKYSLAVFKAHGLDPLFCSMSPTI